MKIRPDEAAKTALTQQARKTEKKPAEKFSEILQRTMDNPAVAKQSPSAPQGPASISQIRLDPVQLDEDRTPILELMEQVLDGLDEYTSRLADTSVPASELEPIIARLESQNVRLNADFQGLPDGDPLKDLLNRILVTSVVEVEKFRRGDYL